MLEIKNLEVNVWEKKVLKKINIKIQQWKNYAILGKNWSWKSSLALCIMWNPNYKIVWWDIIWDNKSILELSADERAKLWIYLAFQNIPEIPWIKVFDFLKAIFQSHFPEKKSEITFLKFKKLLEPLIEQTWLDKDFLFRDLNVWFSGWEKRKLEILIMKLVNPKIIILDEIDSWLDINSIKQLWEMLSNFQSKDTSIVIISHYFWILDYIDLSEIVVLESWSIKLVWDKKILDKIKKVWF